ncbi:nucleolar protein dao-5-like isoform X2 [Anthonomus grandis grandis]|uniref:nucleolar protein dao-5-like isoform X2 n=1 Tax=Anthonomus grandis grandis TaxID=2921223 RepID=UPI002165D363|nr:nucleolar protein dao-5-like isoform X2 [Anthonomus grandis grandis]
MEYEKHIKKLVLGYLKTECKASYKIFLKIHFPHERKHVPTRVAGQTLEDILRMFSKIQDIVQGHLEETDYYKEQPAELWSPTHLEEQLLYLLERKRSSTPTTSVLDRSSRSTSISSNHDPGELTPVNNVEATPEHALPGNCNEAIHRMATDRKSIKNPYFDEMDVSMKLLYDKSFSHNLARNINKQLTPPETACTLSKCNHADTLEKVILTGAENSLFSNSKQSLNHRTYVDDQINGAVSSILAISQEASTSANQAGSTSTDQEASIGKKPEVTTDTALPTQTSVNVDSQPSIPVQKESVKPATSEIQTPKTCLLTVDTQQLTCQTPSRVYTIPPRALTTPGCQQQYVVINQPINVPQSSQMMQLVPKPVVIDSVRKVFPKVNTGLTEEEIMSMPTLILNEKNEVTYADINGIQLNTPFKLNEVQNLQEYFKAFGSSEQSPLIKKTTQKKPSAIKPTPTIKVEIYKHDEPRPKSPKDPPTEAPSSELPNLSETLDSEVPVVNISDVPQVVTRDTPDESKTKSNDKGFLKGSRSVHTPSPLVTTKRKPTPKSSSHVRNLTFPSPVRKTPRTESLQSPSKLNKQKAAKDLFNEDPKQTVVDKPTTKTSPKKSGSPSKAKQKAVQLDVKKVVKKPPVAKKAIATTNTTEVSNSWDASLRKNLPKEEEHKTPARRTSSRRRTRKSSEVDTSDPDGKKLEEALKTPGKAKTANPKKPKVEKVKADKKIIEKPEVLSKPDNKTVLSPSKLYNTTSKRKMEFDGVTPHNPKIVTQQPTMNARKNISSLLETPLKEDPPTNEIREPEPTDSPFTPMLKANLQDLVVGDSFTIATPNFPVTPGLALMEGNANNAYYIAADTGHNKAAEEIIRSEERKSSTRKTDDDDLEIGRSPKVYSRPEMLHAFNKSRVGKKDLDLIEKEVADLSDIEEGSEKSFSLSDGESNKTVLRKQPALKEVKRSQRLSGKSMSVLKAYILDDVDNSVKLNESISQENTTNTSRVKTGSSSDSEVVSREICKKRISNENEKTSASDTTKGRSSSNLPPAKETKPLSKENIKKQDKEADITISSITAEKVKETVLSGVPESQTALPLLTSVKEEMEEKRKRIIELEKSKFCKTPSRKKNTSAKRQIPQTSKRKRRGSKIDEESDLLEKIDSQDEFFIKSGSNLHRKAKETSIMADKNNKDVKEQKVDAGEETRKYKNADENSDETKKTEASARDNQSSPTPSDDDLSFWDTSCAMEEQHHIFDIAYDESNPSTKRFEDYDLSFLKKKISNAIPLEEGQVQIVTTRVTEHSTLWEIHGDIDICKNARRNSSFEARDLPPDSDNENASPKLEESAEPGCAKKRKHRSDSSSSTSSAKRMKGTQIPFLSLNDKNIKTILNKLHGPTDKT